MQTSISAKLIELTGKLSTNVGKLTFTDPVSIVYNPLEYAWDSHKLYLSKYGNSRKKIIFIGMNPGPWGMAQTGVPFGEVEIVKTWLGIETIVGKPKQEHPKRKIEGFACKRSEVSGRRFWGLFKERFSEAELFFRDYFVGNYCPLVFMELEGRNRTPDKIKAVESAPLFEICDSYLRDVVNILEPESVVGVGRFTETCAQRALKGLNIKIGQILHPSPASPAANADWAGLVLKQLKDMNCNI